MEHKLLARHPIGNPRRVWKQDNLILNLPSPAPMSTALLPKSETTMKKTRRAVKTAIDAGFNMMGCLWADPATVEEIVRTAERYDASVLYQDLRRFGGMGDKNIFCETNDYEGVIRDTAKWNCVKGYCMWDEPILEENLQETRKMIDYCEKVRPDLLPFTVANPDYNRLCHWENDAYAPYIDRFLDVIDPVEMCFDYYPIGKREYDPALQLDNSTMWSDLEIVRRAAQKREIPFWFAYQAHRYPWHKIYYTYRFPMTRAMAHAGILHGAKMLDCYTEFDGCIDPETGGKGVFFEEQKKLNGELLALGNTLMALECLRVIHDDRILPGHRTMEGLRTPIEESELLTGALSPRISVSEHRDPYGNMYLMVLNRDYDVDAHIALKLKRPSHVYVVSKEDGEQTLIEETVSEFWTHLAPGDLHLYRIQNAEEAPFTVEYFLEK